MRMKLFSLLLTVLMLGCAAAESLEPLPMDDLSYGPEPKDECYLSDNEYVDESISVKIYEGRYADTDYVYAHVKISHPSQLRTIPAGVYKGVKSGSVQRSKDYNFKKSSTTRGRFVASAANAVISINGDYFTKSECKVVLRMGTQYRNRADGLRDLLIIDKQGNLSYLNAPSQEDYAAYYEANKDNLYQVFCFGPVLVENGVSVLPMDYENGYIGAQKAAQRTALCQLGELEYMLVTSYGNQTDGNKGMTIPEFAKVCEMAGRELNPENGCLLAFNLDGGNSSTMNFKRLDAASGKLKYVKVNCPEIERFLSDIIYFATLVK
ncbi:MAG: phosphodiester glycosidase family protein [Clostridia bacterium]|nr:phosphodiester glycosidase family protein [Clostridia bacterium]